jgi:hypothetical protein
MKDYYQILGIEEEASEKEIEARWAELMKQYPSDLGGRVETDEKIKEINEAYQVLKNPSTRMEYDFERLLKRSVLKKISQRKEKRLGRKKLIIPAGVVVLFLVVVFIIFKMAQLTTPEKPIIATSTPVPEGEILISDSKSVYSEMPEAPDQESSQIIPEEIPESQDVITPFAKLPKKELEPKEKITQKAGKLEQLIPKDMPKVEVPESPKPVSKEISKVEKPKSVVIEPTAAPTYAPIPEEVQKSKVAIVTEKEAPKATIKEAPIEVPKSPKLVSKEISKVEKPKSVVMEPTAAPTYAPIPEEVQKSKVAIATEKETPKVTIKEAPMEVPKEEVKTIPKEPPVSQPSRPEEARPTDQKRKVDQIPPEKPISPVPPPFVKENEVRGFLALYVDRYTQRDAKGFLSLFSPFAIQNQKDGIEAIRKIYSRQFELYERLSYQLKNIEIEILKEIVKVKASYEIEQFSKKGETKQLRGDIEWELVKEGEDLKIFSLKYRNEKTR